MLVLVLLPLENIREANDRDLSMGHSILAAVRPGAWSKRLRQAKVQEADQGWGEWGADQKTSQDSRLLNRGRPIVPWSLRGPWPAWNWLEKSYLEDSGVILP